MVDTCTEKKGAIFLDRDGVIIVNREDYVKSWDEVHFVPGAAAAIQRLNSAGWRVVMVTNQSCVGRGIVTDPFVREIHERLVAEIAESGGRIDRVYFCPHHPEAGCDCRKPLPGMLQTAATELGIDLQQSYIIGDSLTDIQAGAAAGVKGVLVRTGHGSKHEPRVADGTAPAMPIAIVDALPEACDYLLNLTGPLHVA
jgi:D-glycero-D-manno-heptose 1,7-bisphosphate phosphatase